MSLTEAVWQYGFAIASPYRELAVCACGGRRRGRDGYICDGTRLGGNTLERRRWPSPFQAAGLPLRRALTADGVEPRLPVPPQFSVIAGGPHAADDRDFQEFIIGAWIGPPPGASRLQPSRRLDRHPLSVT